MAVGVPLRNAGHDRRTYRVINDDLRKAAAAAIKNLDKARKAIGALTKAKEIGLSEALVLVERAADALRAIPVEGLLQSLDQQHAALDRLSNEALARRREELLRAAKGAGWESRRLQDYDHVGCFKVSYKRGRVTLQLGSETWDAFDEADGKKVFIRIQEAQSKLDRAPFERDAFFSIVRNAVRLAKIQGLDRDGKVPIRKLYPLVVLVRQSHDDGFMKRPSARQFRDYPICQFIYDLARFGAEGWSIKDGERLASHTPNMGTIAKGEAVTLPVLSGTGPGPQLAALWIERV